MMPITAGTANGGWHSWTVSPREATLRTCSRFGLSENHAKWSVLSIKSISNGIVLKICWTSFNVNRPVGKLMYASLIVGCLTDISSPSLFAFSKIWMYSTKWVKQISRLSRASALINRPSFEKEWLALPIKTSFPGNKLASQSGETRIWRIWTWDLAEAWRP